MEVEIQRACEFCGQRIGEECGIDGHEVYDDGIDRECFEGINKMDKPETIKCQCKRCESECIVISKTDDDGNAWDKEVLAGELCSCSKWEII